MINLKPLFYVQIKHKNRWVMTAWARECSEKEAIEGLKTAKRAYKLEEYRVIKIYRRYEVIKS